MGLVTVAAIITLAVVVLSAVTNPLGRLIRWLLHLHTTTIRLSSLEILLLPWKPTLVIYGLTLHSNLLSSYLALHMTEAKVDLIEIHLPSLTSFFRHPTILVIIQGVTLILTNDLEADIQPKPPPSSPPPPLHGHATTTSTTSGVGGGSSKLPVGSLLRWLVTHVQLSLRDVYVAYDWDLGLLLPPSSPLLPTTPPPTPSPPQVAASMGFYLRRLTVTPVKRGQATRMRVTDLQVFTDTQQYRG